jgi:hypothetical protein
MRPDRELILAALGSPREASSDAAEIPVPRTVAVRSRGPPLRTLREVRLVRRRPTLRVRRSGGVDGCAACRHSVCREERQHRLIRVDVPADDAEPRPSWRGCPATCPRLMRSSTTSPSQSRRRPRTRRLSRRSGSCVSTNELAQPLRAAQPAIVSGMPMIRLRMLRPVVG